MAPSKKTGESYNFGHTVITKMYPQLMHIHIAETKTETETNADTDADTYTHTDTHTDIDTHTDTDIDTDRYLPGPLAPLIRSTNKITFSL